MKKDFLRAVRYFVFLFPSVLFANEEAIRPSIVNPLSEQVEKLKQVTQDITVSGYGFTNYIDRHAENSTFTAGFNPIFIYRMTDNISFEGELEVRLEDGDTDIDLEHAYLSYSINNYMSVGAGKFLSPFGMFRERLHPQWINKLADAPLGYSGDAAQLVADDQLGVQVRGRVPFIRDSKLNYALYVSNAPALKTDTGNAGELDFDNTDDNNHNKAIGLRVGLVPPIKDFEIGVSYEFSKVGEEGTSFDNIEAKLWGVDLSWVKLCEKLKGVFDIKYEHLWSDIDVFDYGTSGGEFKNDRRAYYAQFAYRPTQVSHRILQNLEFVFRFDKVDQPEDAPTFADRKRLTGGINYWLTKTAVIKAAYQNDDKDDDEDDRNAYFIELAAGF